MIKKLFYLLFLFLASCHTESNHNNLAKLVVNDSLDSKSFSFTVSNKFISQNKSPIDKQYPMITKSEVKLLKRLLKKNNYCIHDGKLLFELTSKQSEIYDITLSGAVEQEYKTGPIAPITYFGKCL